MLCARSLLLISLTSVAISTEMGAAQSLFPFLNAAPPSPETPVILPPAADPNYLPPDADPNYSTPGGFDKDVNMSLTTRKEVVDPTGQPPGTVTINTRERKLYLSLGDGRALQYGIGVGRQGFSWKGVAEVGRKAFWPGWTPPPEMLARQPGLPDHMDGGMENPLGARALYLFQGKKDTLFRIHGTNEPNTIGKAVSSGCIRMLDSDVIDLYQRVAKGTRVVVL
jgi:lipoprotein-anchoring transpeptidase ErfK/SrfK